MTDATDDGADRAAGDGPTPTPGIHHVTCVAGDPQRNLDTWVETLGLRLVKRSINQDDPGTYHFFYGDAEGTPGTSVTFFPWTDLPEGEVGAGQVSRTAFRVPEGSLDYWEDRFDERGVDYDDREERFGETVLPFRDPDGLPVELVAVEVPADDPTTAWTAHVPESAAIRGFHSVTLWIDEPERTRRLLRTMGLEAEATATDAATGGERTRFAASGPVGKYVDVVAVDRRGSSGRGTVHHVAFQTPTDDDQSGMRDAVASMGLRPTQQIDRHWFRSVYFREFAGVLFELATSDPGYASDEPLDALGERLVLPGRFEDRRDEIESGLVDVTVPRADGEFAAHRAD
ncbi:MULTISPECIES: VOC family protein [unclassified Halorubrum]|uniref:VOC family protein n=1 Tax=unclassified Halorubrum TaxID=2642239 RepID=UPI0010F4457A|nr:MULTISPECIES: VOC family protein [unclassified Halorubrum]TKX45192.1 ring-cleaving dioxygenase [Halorubrum sp. ARQ200]TKX51634.1 ring-cleaving dioxygenase [Halorubrum sp. ASP121]